MNPAGTESLFAQSKLQLQQGQSAQAAQLLQEILKSQPNHLGAIEALAGLKFHSGDIPGVVPLLQRAVTLQPNSFVFHSNLGTALAMLGRLDEAITVFTAAAQLSPHSADTWAHLGLALQQRNRLSEAAQAFKNAIAIDARHMPALSMLSQATLDAKQYELTRDLCEMLLAANPNDVETRFNLAGALHHVGRSSDAIDQYQKVLAHDANHIRAMNNLAMVLGAANRYEEAINLLRRFVALQPESAEAHSNLGSALHQAGFFDEAERVLRAALKLDPAYAAAEWNLAVVLLSQGDLKAGFAAYESRLRLPRTIPVLQFQQPVWDGSSIAGKTILLHSEQGYGDAIQFIRYARLLRDIGAKVLVLCPTPLQRLLAQMPELSQVFTRPELVPTFDVHCSIGSLPSRFKTTLDTIPNQVPYIEPNSKDVANWKQKLDAFVAGRPVGITWAGSSEHQNDANRSLKLTAFQELAQIDGVTFIGIQMGDAAAQPPPPGMKLVNVGDQLADFADTAALIANLDLVISVDTSVAHLAGAMGKATWVLLPEPADFRWMRNRTDSPWYPTMRLFCQPTRGDWATPIRQLASELKAVRKQL